MASARSSFDSASDDVLCSYDDVSNHQLSNGKISDRFDEDLPDYGLGKELVSVYSQQYEYPKDEITDVIKKCMKKYTDNLIQHFEGISGRLSQLEIQCYKLERNIGEFHADSIRDQGEADTKLKTVVKHLQEVHRSIQIIRDKHELAETRSELTKLQVAPKESNSPTQSQKYDTPILPSVHEQHNIINQSIPVFQQKSQLSPPEPHYIQAQPLFLPPEPYPQVLNQAQHQSFVIPKPNHAQSNPQFLYPNSTIKPSIPVQQPHHILYQSQTHPAANPIPNPNPISRHDSSLQTQTQQTPQFLIVRTASGSISLQNQSQVGHSAVYSIDGSKVQTYLHPNNVPCMQNQQIYSSNTGRFQQMIKVHPYVQM